MNSVYQVDSGNGLLTVAGLGASVEKNNIDKDILEHGDRIVSYGNLLWEYADTPAAFDNKRQFAITASQITREEMAWGEFLCAMQVLENLSNIGDYNNYARQVKGMLQNVRELDQHVVDKIVDKFNLDSVDFYKRTGQFMVEYSAEGLGVFWSEIPRIYFKEICNSYKYRLSSRSRCTSYSGRRGSTKTLSMYNSYYMWGESLSTTYYTGYNYSKYYDSTGTLYVTKDEICYISNKQHFHFLLRQLRAIQIDGDEVHLYKSGRQLPFILSIKNLDYFITVLTNLRYGYDAITPILLKKIEVPNQKEQQTIQNNEIGLSMPNVEENIVECEDEEKSGINWWLFGFVGVVILLLAIAFNESWGIVLSLGIIFVLFLFASETMHDMWR